jgi:membrane protein insertase Oxa1/YidC/SpoIIIJ
MVITGFGWVIFFYFVVGGGALDWWSAIKLVNTLLGLLLLFRFAKKCFTKSKKAKEASPSSETWNS